jgi:GNAT superfamily N-acetyltransferase
MTKTIEVHRAVDDDADIISELVQATIRISNSQDYPSAVIDRVAANFTPDAVRHFMATRSVFVARVSTAVVGTASLEGDTVRTVFVRPDSQRSGVGKALMAAVEAFGRDQGNAFLRVPSSLTAKTFYTALGYSEIQEVHLGEETTLLMEKKIA